MTCVRVGTPVGPLFHLGILWSLKLPPLALTGEEHRVTLMPLGFCVAPQESEPAVDALVSGVLGALAEDFGLDLRERVGWAYLDGGAALLTVFSARFPAADVVRCLQHVKKNVVGKTRLWKQGNRNKEVKHWVEVLRQGQECLRPPYFQAKCSCMARAPRLRGMGGGIPSDKVSAFLPPDLFHLFWTEAFKRLEQEGEDRFVKYLRENIFVGAEKISADWQSHPGQR